MSGRTTPIRTLSSNIDVSVLVKEFNFSFDEVILVVEEKMKQGGVAALLELIFCWSSKVLCSQYVDLILPKMKSPCCNNSYWLSHGKYQKTMKTTLGKLKLELHRMKCHSCQKTLTPFLIFFNLENKNWSHGLEKTCLEMIVDQSNRRTSNHLKISNGIDISKNIILFYSRHR